ncbi:uncharacterized protein LOC106150385 [Lingula anatina]|uniref:Uncharacterized protein LOC106150385 n=1 Tax=Lingula anatina TaxID=7574 RepID=A0A1S3GY55_LINAN|nr:uncharacterized protein LOC106150385 [Lingula anatina]|eukprot:XP_013378592.1 uncharacterized protein LOC106150385 [Lingula anatina]
MNVWGNVLVILYFESLYGFVESAIDYDEREACSRGGFVRLEDSFQGTIKSPSFPTQLRQGDSRTIECTWLIPLLPGQRLSITFDYYSLQSTFNCAMSHLYILVKEGYRQFQLLNVCHENVVKSGKRLEYRGKTPLPSTILVIFRTQRNVTSREKFGFSFQYKIFVPCTPLLSPTNGRLSVHNSTATLVCDDGYVLKQGEGNTTIQTITCQHTGLWSEALDECIRSTGKSGHSLGHSSITPSVYRSVSTAPVSSIANASTTRSPDVSHSSTGHSSATLPNVTVSAFTVVAGDNDSNTTTTTVVIQSKQPATSTATARTTGRDTVVVLVVVVAVLVSILVTVATAYKLSKRFSKRCFSHRQEGNAREMTGYSNFSNIDVIQECGGSPCDTKDKVITENSTLPNTYTIESRSE